MNTIAREVTVYTPWPSTITYRAVLSYDPADPYAVTLRFYSPSGRTGGITYVFARELLVDAVELGHDTGENDVRIHPSDGWLFIDVYPEGEFPPLIILHESAAHFLALTYSAVPVGTEACHIDWAAELAILTGGAA